MLCWESCMRRALFSRIVIDGENCKTNTVNQIRTDIFKSLEQHEYEIMHTR